MLAHALGIETTRVVPGPHTAKQTVPTGLSGEPPSGPAMPVIATATADPHTRFAPSAISRAVGSLTAPKSAMVSGLTPSTLIFTSSA
jgi:SHS family lactate transporter-like MFS transporter